MMSSSFVWNKVRTFHFWGHHHWEDDHVGHEFSPPTPALHPSLLRTKLYSSSAPWKEGETPKWNYWAKLLLAISNKESSKYVSISFETLPVHKPDLKLENDKRNTVSSGFNFLLVYYGSCRVFQDRHHPKKSTSVKFRVCGYTQQPQTHLSIPKLTTSWVVSIYDAGSTPSIPMNKPLGVPKQCQYKFRFPHVGSPMFPTNYPKTLLGLPTSSH